MADLPYFAHIRPEPGKRVAWVLTVLMHVLLAMILIYGIRWQTSAPETISVDLVRYPAPTDATKPAMPPQEQKVPRRPQKVEQEAPPAPSKAEILRKEPEKPKSIKEKATQSIDAIAKFLQHEVNRTRQNRVVDEAARAQAQLKANQAAAAHNKGLADYLTKIRGKIRGNIVLPPAINGNPESIFIVTQVLTEAGGEILSVKLKTPSGNPALDAAVERAILKSSPLPKPDDPSLFERELSIKYRPLED
ncbi:Cell division and transport-associated protein TolA [Georgfuchsia toluolica]|uniref:Cell division and transport-associated protein TolA n=1 Tax=Georgfuchsia toluolica TaxID=424218 RepID=A0A916J813_9PROT|nr:TonB C-terminal domain-containing protein [Georgfuchsia toluolica]CAG4884882.1 Cell division and transport-associated protein TolA [Georgfuchsia toluolica]